MHSALRWLGKAAARSPAVVAAVGLTQSPGLFPISHCEPSVKAPRFDANEELARENAELKEQLLRVQEKLATFETTDEEVPVYKIVITGGPCAGKTTALTRLRERLETAGWRVFVVPEAATLLFHNGARFPDFLSLGEGGVIQFQTQLATLQMHLERTMDAMAKASGTKSVLLCDRGVVDGKAYIDQQGWAMVLDQLGLTEAEVRDRRYDAVIHMVTAAQGAEKYYTLAQEDGEEGTARHESPEDARSQDEKTAQSWIGSEHLYFIDNNEKGGFPRKVDRVVDCVFKVIGEPVTGHALRKLQLPQHLSADQVVAAANAAGVDNCRVFRNTTTYVNMNDRIRMRSDREMHGAAYSFQTFGQRGGRLRRVREQRIDGHDYIQRLKSARTLGYQPVEKELVCFKWGGTVYKVNIFMSPRKMTILEVESESPDAHIAIPPFLIAQGAQVEEVTCNEKFDTRNIAQKLDVETTQ